MADHPIPPVATVASQMVFTDGGYFVIVLNVTGAQGATFAGATCTDSDGNNRVSWPMKSGVAPFQTTFNNQTLLRLILVAHLPSGDGFAGSGLLTITLTNPAVTVPPITVIPRSCEPMCLRQPVVVAGPIPRDGSRLKSLGKAKCPVALPLPIT